MNAETMMQVVAILTESGRWIGPEADTVPDDGSSTFDSLLNDLLKVEVAVDANATPAEMAEAVGQAISPRLTAVAAAFAAAFHQLAVEHDRLDPEVTSADVLRSLAVRANEPGRYDN
ncbi:hypothetical protein [Streptomyces zaomyceticus]|uniref:hypothetical protein n=1 Tax=Streptomyces zaomyceticus TaxID=68286 RepID=UPI0037A60C51